jgi:hypothetical protein
VKRAVSFVSWTRCFTFLVGLMIPLAAGTASAEICEVVDAGGTVALPPAGCDYMSPHEVFVIIDGLPPGTTIELTPTQSEFSCSGLGFCTVAIPPGLCEAPGGSDLPP